MNNLLKNIPSVHSLLETEEGKDLCGTYGRDRVRKYVNDCLESLRTSIREANGSSPQDPVDSEQIQPDTILHQVDERIQSVLTPSIRRVVNGTGVIIHTGLGRAVLGESTLDHMKEVNRGYSLLAMDREGKERVRREHRAASMISELTGAEAATVVNNNAAAVLLLLSAFGNNREVVISRGELVEIGGSFRVPDVMEQSGAQLREVGTTNKTHLNDYEQAITEDTSILMKVHTSNYQVVGFQQEVGMQELSRLADRHGLLAVEDLGSGALVDVSRYGVGQEPIARQCIENGADLICFSCDKLLGGPQAGVIAGRESLIDEIRSHPLFRALRLDKLILSALEHTLHLYLQPGEPTDHIPVLRMIARSPEAIKEQAQELSDQIEQLDAYRSQIIEGTSRIGGGSLPGTDLPTWLAEIQHVQRPAHEISLKLRFADPPVFGRVQDDTYLIDPRTLIGDDNERIVNALQAID